MSTTRGAAKSYQRPRCSSRKRRGVTTKAPTALSTHVNESTQRRCVRAMAPTALSTHVNESTQRRCVRAMASSSGDTGSSSSSSTYASLANGSDVRGVATGANATLTPERAFFIAAAFARRSHDKSGASPLRLCVGLDPRTSGPALASAAAAGARLGAPGCELLDGTLATTPCVFMATQLLGAHAGIMLTASHLPPDRNGMKLFTARGGGASKSDVQAILEEAAAMHAAHDEADLEARLRAPPAFIDAGCMLPVYAKHLRERICALAGVGTGADAGADVKPLQGMKVAVDAGNGSGGFFVEQVLRPLGADTTGSQLLDPDGTFPVHPPNPEDAGAMRSACAAVTEAGAHLGIVFDTDVDRCAVVAGDGTPVNRNRLIAVVADIVLREHPGTTIVTDSVTSRGLADFIEARGGRHLRYMRGYKNVIDKGVQLNKDGQDTQLMIETSGHGALKENYYLDDGCYLAVRILSELARRNANGLGVDVKSLYSGLAEPGDELEMRLAIEDTRDFKGTGAKAIKGLEAWIDGKLPFAPPPPGWSLEPENHEGIRINISGGLWPVQDGWLLLRQSLHDPLLVLNIETAQPNGCIHVAAAVAIWLLAGGKELPGWTDVDTSKITEAAATVEKGGNPTVSSSK